MQRILAAAISVFLVSALAAQAAEPDEQTIAYLQKLQNKDGGFLPAAGAARTTLRATSAAIRALKYAGGALKNRSATANFVKSCHDKATGGFADVPGGKPDVTTTAIGLMAVVKLKMPIEDYEAGTLKFLGEHTMTFEDIRITAAGLEALGKKGPNHDAWLEQVLKMRNPDGTFGHGDSAPRATGGASVAVLRLGGKVEHPEVVLKTLNAGQLKSGGFGKDATEADLETSYRIVRAFHMLKARPEKVAQLRDFIARCRNEDGGYGVKPDQPSSVSGTYFASIILHWLK